MTTDHSAEREREIVAQWHRDNPPPPGPPDPPRKVCLDCGAVETWNFITQRLNAHIGKDRRPCPGRYRRPEREKSEVERLREQVVHLAGRLGEAHGECASYSSAAARLADEVERLRAALRPYLSHHRGCARFGPPFLGRRLDGAPACSCGLDAALTLAGRP